MPKRTIMVNLEILNEPNVLKYRRSIDMRGPKQKSLILVNSTKPIPQSSLIQMDNSFTCWVISQTMQVVSLDPVTRWRPQLSIAKQVTTSEITFVANTKVEICKHQSHACEIKSNKHVLASTFNCWLDVHQFNFASRQNLKTHLPFWKTPGLKYKHDC